MSSLNDTDFVTKQMDVNDHCDGTVSVTYNTAIASICVSMGLVGLVYIIAGYRCFKAVMFLSGLIFGGTVVYILCQEDGVLHHTLAYEAVVGIALGIGVLCGFITMLVRYIGLFLQGFYLGLLLAVGAILALQSFYHPFTPWIPAGILFGTGILFSLLTLKWQKNFLIISTSVTGGALICICLDYFLETFALLKYIWKAMMANSTASTCWYAWFVLGTWPVLLVLGCVVQAKFTATGYDHTNDIVWRGRHKRLQRTLARQPHPPSLAPSPPVQHSGAVTSQGVMPNFDTLPPSYNDCVEHGVGHLIHESDAFRVVRTKHGSYLSNDLKPYWASPSPSSARGSQGTTVDDHGPSASSCRAPVTPAARHSPQNWFLGRAQWRASSREHTPSQLRCHGGIQRSGQLRSCHVDNGSRPSGARSRTSQDDRQLLLSSDTRHWQNPTHPTQQRQTPNEAVAAHARRLRAIQQRSRDNV